jgi:hypothetical protein
MDQRSGDAPGFVPATQAVAGALRLRDALLSFASKKTSFDVRLCSRDCTLLLAACARIVYVEHMALVAKDAEVFRRWVLSSRFDAYPMKGA